MSARTIRAAENRFVPRRPLRRSQLLAAAAAAAAGLWANQALAVVWSYSEVATGSCAAKQGCGHGSGHAAVVNRHMAVKGPGDSAASVVSTRGSAEASARAGAGFLDFATLKSITAGRPDFDGAYSWNYAFTEGVVGYRWDDATLVAPVSTFIGKLTFSNLGGYSGYASASMALLYDDVQDPDVARLWARDDGLGGFTANCSTRGAGAISSTGQVFTRGQVVSFTQEACDGSFTFKQGETYYLWTRLITFVAGNGVVDASHTFTVDFGPGVSDELRQTIVTHSIPVAGGLVVPGVPEPSVWAMLITGFAGAGLMLRRRMSAERTLATPAS